MMDADEFASGALGITTLPQPDLPSIEAMHLGIEEAHIWLADLESLPLFENWRDILSRDEAERASRFHFDRDRQHFITCRALLRILLGNYLDLAPAAVVFRYSLHHKPSLAVPSSDIRFNLSHSGEKGVFAFIRGRELGVDIEQIRHDFETQSVAERFFSSAEREALARIPPEMSHEAFFHCWTRKEAFVKAKGDGLFLPLDQFDVSLGPGEPAQLLETRPNIEERDRWSLCALEVGSQYAGALVVEGKAVSVVNYRIPESSAPSASPEKYHRPD
jgi:4'-phosphopantetheinyl transferase